EDARALVPVGNVLPARQFDLHLRPKSELLFVLERCRWEAFAGRIRRTEADRLYEALALGRVRDLVGSHQTTIRPHLNASQALTRAGGLSQDEVIPRIRP